MPLEDMATMLQTWAMPRLLILILVGMPILHGCASLRELPPRTEPWTNYRLNEEQHASTGSTMITWLGDGHFLPGYCVTDPVTGQGTALSPTRGERWAARYRYMGNACPGGAYVLVNPTYYEEKLGFIVTEDGRVACERAQIRASGIQKGRQYSVTKPPGTQSFRPCEPALADTRGAPVKWELVYSGRSGDEVQLLYREYTTLAQGDFARQAFYQNLSYDLSRGTRITFRETTIDIINADNSGVTFKVISH